MSTHVIIDIEFLKQLYKAACSRHWHNSIQLKRCNIIKLKILTQLSTTATNLFAKVAFPSLVRGKNIQINYALFPLNGCVNMLERDLWQQIIVLILYFSISEEKCKRRRKYE